MDEDIKKQMLDSVTLAFEIMADDKFTKSIATMLWKLYLELKMAGFSEQAAIDIVVGFSKMNTNNNK